MHLPFQASRWVLIHLFRLWNETARVLNLLILSVAHHWHLRPSTRKKHIGIYTYIAAVEVSYLSFGVSNLVSLTGASTFQTYITRKSDMDVTALHFSDCSVATFPFWRGSKDSKSSNLVHS